jgi:hypothetical protein
MTVVESVRDLEHGRFRDTFKPDSPHGRMALASLILFLATPPLVYFVSGWFLILFVVAWSLSLYAHLGSHRGLTRPQRLVRAGQTVALNAVVLIVAMFAVGIIVDFVLEERPHFGESIAGGFSMVHLLFGTGLLLGEGRRD